MSLHICAVSPDPSLLIDHGIFHKAGCSQLKMVYPEGLQVIISKYFCIFFQENKFCPSKQYFAASSSGSSLSKHPVIIPPANFVCGGYTVFTLSVRACVRPSVLQIST